MRQLVHLDNLSVFQLVERDDLHSQGRSVLFRSIENVNVGDVIAIGDNPLKGHLGRWC
jgi:hypothetical protein